jgi:hypothetical protein
MVTVPLIKFDNIFFVIKLDRLGGPSMRGFARPPFIEPSPTDAGSARDKLYSEMRNIAEQAERLAHRARIAAAGVATLALRDDDAEIG